MDNKKKKKKKEPLWKKMLKIKPTLTSITKEKQKYIDSLNK